MKTVVQINSVINKGSTGRIAQQIGEHVENQGWRHFLVYGRPSNPTNLDAYKISSYTDNLIHYGLSLALDAHGLGSQITTSKLCRWLSQINPSLVHLHNLHGYYLNYPILAKYLQEKRIPVVWTLHDCWAFTGHCSYYSDINCTKWHTECHTCPKKRSYPASITDRSKSNFERKQKLFKAFDSLQLVTVSDWLKGEVQKSFLSKLPVVTIHNGVDTKVFHENYSTAELDERYHLKGRFVAVAAATSWSPTKGFQDYLRMAEKLDENEKIVLIGLNDHQIANLPPGIIGITRTESSEELARWYRRANVVLNLSTQETFGMTTVEGFACGSPSIVYNATASPELINEKVGYVVEAGDVDAVYSKMQELRSENKLLSSDCVHHVHQNFNSKKQYLNYIKLYDRLL